MAGRAALGVLLPFKERNMRGQSLLKATLLKETYGPLNDWKSAERNHAVHALPSHLSGEERRFLDLMVPNVSPVKELQQLQQTSPVPDFGLPCEDLISAYEELITEAKESNSYPSVALVGEKPPPKSSSSHLDFDRSTRLSTSPSEILRGYRSLIFQEAVEEFEERSRIPSSDDWEQSSVNDLLTENQRLSRTQHNCDLTLQIAVGAANGEQTSVVQIKKAVTVQTVSNGRNHYTGGDAPDEHLNQSLSVQSDESRWRGVKIEAEYAISSGSSERSDCDQEKCRSHDNSHCSVQMSSQMCGEGRSTLKSTGKTLPRDEISTSGLAGQDRPPRQRRPCLSALLKSNSESLSESIEDTLAECHSDGRKLGFLEHLAMFGKSRSMKGRTTFTAAKEDLTDGLSEASNRDQTSSAESHVDSYKPLYRRPERLQRCQTSKGITAATVIKPSDLASSPTSDVWGNQPLRRYSERLQRSQKMKTGPTRPEECDQILCPNPHDCRRYRRSQTKDIVRTAAKQDIPEVSERFGKSRPTTCWTGLATWQTPLGSYQDLLGVLNRLGRSQPAKERTPLTHCQSSSDQSSPTDTVSSGNTSVPISFHDYSSTTAVSIGNRSTSNSFHGHSPSTTVSSGNTSVPISFHDYSSTTAVSIGNRSTSSSFHGHSPTTTVSTGERSRKPALPTTASNRLQKLQQILGKGRRIQRIQPVVDTDREKANSVLNAPKARFTLRDGILEDGSSSQQLRDGASSPVTIDDPKLESKPGFGRLLRKLKKICTSQNGEVRTNFVGARLHNIAEKGGHKNSSLASSQRPPVGNYKLQSRGSGFVITNYTVTAAPKRILPQRLAHRRTSARSPRSSTFRRLSLKQNTGPVRYRRPNVFVASNNLRRDVLLVRDKTKTGEAAAGRPYGWTEDTKAPELRSNSTLGQRQLPRSTSRFRREFVATQLSSARPTYVHGN